MKKLYQRLIRILFKAISYFIGAILTYLFFSIILSLIPVNPKQCAKSSEYSVFLATNGVHLDIILPYNDSLANWKKIIEFDDKSRAYINHIGIGWGDKNFYINTPTWSDLTFSAAFSAAFLKGEAAMHVSPYRNIPESDNVLKISLTKDEYKGLIQFIQNSFMTDADGKSIEVVEAGYSDQDKFYNAHKSYHLFYTCNTWVNSSLKKAGVRSCLWTPFDKGIFFQLKRCKRKK